RRDPASGDEHVDGSAGRGASQRPSGHQVGTEAAGQAAAATARAELVKRVLQLALGVMTAIGGFVDIGNLVTSGITGARFGMSLAWALLLGTAGMVLYGEMAGRVTAVARRPVFHVVRERLGVRMGLVNLIASLVLNLLT